MKEGERERRGREEADKIICQKAKHISAEMSHGAPCKAPGLPLHCLGTLSGQKDE